MTFNLGLTPPPEPEKPANDPYPRPPVTVNEIRIAKAQIEEALKGATNKSRLYYGPSEVQNLLLDAYSILDRLTSPAQLVAMAQQLVKESKDLWTELRLDDDSSQ